MVGVGRTLNPIQGQFPLSQVAPSRPGTFQGSLVFSGNSIPTSHSPSPAPSLLRRTRGNLGLGWILSLWESSPEGADPIPKSQPGSILPSHVKKNLGILLFLPLIPSGMTPGAEPDPAGIEERSWRSQEIRESWRRNSQELSLRNSQKSSLTAALLGEKKLEKLGGFGEIPPWGSLDGIFPEHSQGRNSRGAFQDHPGNGSRSDLGASTALSWCCR